MPSDQISPRKRFGIVAGISVLLLALIIPAKRYTFDKFSSGDDEAATDTMLDDTTYVEPSLSDSAIIGDDRPVDRAGFEDGYTSGSTDASMRQGRGTYDENNPYTTGERDSYVRSYREGYQQGQTFGKDHPATSSKQDTNTIEDLVRQSDQRLQ